MIKKIYGTIITNYTIMKTANIWDIFIYEWELVECVWINLWMRSIIFQPYWGKTCECCGQRKQWNVIEQCLNFQEWAKPINTIDVWN